MRMKWIVCACVALIMGCADRQMDCPDGLVVDTSHMDTAIRAEYSAEHVKNRVIIHAKGELPAGYEAIFVQSMTRIYPPEFVLMRHRMHGEYRAMQKEFDVCVAFKTEEAVETVTVHDATGPHEIRVSH